MDDNRNFKNTAKHIKNNVKRICNHTKFAQNEVSGTQNNGINATAVMQKITSIPSKKLYIGIAILIAVSVIVFYKPKFERVQDQVLEVVGILSTGDDYFGIDTNPYDKPYDDLEPWEQLSFVSTQERAVEGIKLANELLGFNSSVYSKMLNTTALMGRQSEETDKYRVSWTYHPDTGLKVIYEVK